MNDAPSPTPAIDPLRAAYDQLRELEEITQALQRRFAQNGRPYLTFRARELEANIHDMLDTIEHTCCGWEPNNHVDR